METIELSGRTGQEVHEELEAPVGGHGLSAGRVFSAGRRLGGQKGDPQECGSLLHYGLRGTARDLPGCVPEVVRGRTASL